MVAVHWIMDRTVLKAFYLWKKPQHGNTDDLIKCRDELEHVHWMSWLYGCEFANEHLF